MAKVKINGVEYNILEVKINEKEGWGHHSFEALVEKDGKKYWAYSSGCSCDGYAHVDEADQTVKVLELYDGDDLEFSNY